MRIGKGFSKGEIQNAGLTPYEAKMHGIPIDHRRRTSHEWNVELLKKHMVTVPLTKVKGIGDVTAKKLQGVGLQDVYDLANCNVNDLVKQLGYSKTTLTKWQDEARRLIE